MGKINVYDKIVLKIRKKGKQMQIKIFFT